MYFEVFGSTSVSAKGRGRKKRGMDEGVLVAMDIGELATLPMLATRGGVVIPIAYVRVCIYLVVIT